MRWQFHSLRHRILGLATVPLVALLVALLWISHQTMTASVEATAAGRIADAASVATELVGSQHRALRAQARVTASDPRFFATFTVPVEERGPEFVTTMEHLGAEFLQITDADFLEVFDREGGGLLRVDRDGGTDGNWTDSGAGRASILAAADRAVSSDLLLAGGRAVMVVDVPVFLGQRQEAVLRMGRWIDSRFAEEVRRLTGADVAVGRDDLVVLTTWDEPGQAGFAAVRADADRERSPVRPLSFGDEEFLCVDVGFAGHAADSGFTVRLGRSTAAELADLRRAEQLMLAIGLCALLTTIVLSFSIAVGVTRPLRALVGAARRIGEGDYSRPVPVEGRDEVAELARTFEESRQALAAHVRRLEDLDRRRGEFLTLAGHEIRTPLTVVTSFNDMLHEGAFGALPPEVTETTAMIGAQLARLNELVTDILDLTALEATPDKAIEPASVNLVELVGHVEERQREARADREVDVRWRRPAFDTEVHGDERLLGRAFRSLLDNAVRFTPDGGRVEVTLLERGTQIHLSVSDDGIGISPDEIRWICDKLYEGGDIEHHSSGGLGFRASGMGIGLSITRAVLAAHGGRLEVESRPGQGSCFTMVLPARRDPDRHPEDLTQNTPEGLRC